MPPRKRSRGVPTPRTLSGVFGTVRIREFIWWAAWLDGRDPAACLSRQPDGSGWVQLPLIAESVVSVLVGAVFQVDPDPAVRAARLWLQDNGVPFSAREDSLAVNAYHRCKPAYPGVAQVPFGAPTQAPWWAAELGCAWPPTRAEITAAYRLRSQVTHPDKPGGNAAAFERTRRAYEAAIGWVATREEEG